MHKCEPMHLQVVKGGTPFRMGALSDHDHLGVIGHTQGEVKTVCSTREVEPSVNRIPFIISRLAFFSTVIMQTAIDFEAISRLELNCRGKRHRPHYRSTNAQRDPYNHVAAKENLRNT